MNLLSGLLAIAFVFRGDLTVASVLVGIAALFDFSDGLAARLLNARSPVGLQLDSLADIVSFGVTPGFMMFVLMSRAWNLPEFFIGGLPVAPLLAFMLPVMSAIRLARFNTDSRQVHQFIGLPTPASAIFFVSLPLVAYQAQVKDHVVISSLLENYWLLISITVIFSILMVSPIYLISFKAVGKEFHDRMTGIVLLVIGLGLFFVFRFYALPVMVVVYILLSIMKNSRKPH